MRNRFVLTLVAFGLLSFLSGVTVASAVGDSMALQYCVNELDDSFINKCHRDFPSGILTVIANFIAQWINPRAQAIIAIAVLLIHPLLHFNHARKPYRSEVIRSFNLSRLDILNYIHRLGFALTLDVVLYTVFRQSRPCRCTTDGINFQHFGSIYGMPSGDAMAGGILAATIFDSGIFGKKFSIPVSILVVVAAAAERVVLGFHTVSQVSMGNLFAFILHIYSTRAPQMCIFIDVIVQFILGCVLLNVDPALIYGFSNMNNLFAWFLWGVSFNILVAVIMGRIFYHKNTRALLKVNLLSMHENTLFHADAFQKEEMPILAAEKSFSVTAATAAAAADESEGVSRMSDGRFVLAAVIVFAAINLLSSLISEYNWFGRQ